jgi:hypothetical protein
MVARRAVVPSTSRASHTSEVGSKAGDMPFDKTSMETTADPRPSESVAADRRRAPRSEVRATVRGAGSSFLLKLENVSEGGCLVYSGGLLTVGDIHRLRFEDGDGCEIVIYARVIHVIGIDGHPGVSCVAGLEFTWDKYHTQQPAITRLLALVS